MTTEYRYIEPLDVLFLRGNKLFGDAGSYGECLMPPWPSVASGAIRSRMLVDDEVELSEFAKGNVSHPTLGTPTKPGSFTLAGFYLARKHNGNIEILMQPPADVIISRDKSEQLQIKRLSPQKITLPSSFPLAMLPVLAQGSVRSKPVGDYWLTQAGWADYLNGKTPKAKQLLKSSALWTLDARTGIGMNPATRSTEEGKLFSSQVVVMQKNMGFVVAINGAQAPIKGLLRFGGDGRGASIEVLAMNLPQADYSAIVSSKRCCIVLTSPGLFADGWKLPGTDSDNHVTLAGGITAKLVSAAVPRAQTLSGWDLAAHNGQGQPKPAQRIVPTGSVYWLEDLHATPEALGKLAKNGLWSEVCEDKQRKAEGFNRLAISAWCSQDKKTTSGEHHV